VDLQAPDVAGDVTITLPNATGPFALESYVDAAVAAIPGIGSNVVQAVKTDTFSTSSTTFADVTGLSVTITPTSATAKVLVIVNVQVGFTTTVANRTFHWTLDRSGNLTGTDGFLFLDSSVSTSAEQLYAGSIAYLDSPASATAQTYKVRSKVSNAEDAAFVNRVGVGGASGLIAQSSITAIEVAP
jgi:hypothetical protein